jgi:hypothetical protein
MTPKERLARRRTSDEICVHQHSRTTVCFSTACWPVAIVQNEQQYVPETEQPWGRPIEAIFEHWAVVTEFLLRCADEARTLATNVELYER